MTVFTPTYSFENYFKNKPENYSDLDSAQSAYHNTSRSSDTAHSFQQSMTPEIFRNEFQYNKFRNEKCEWCGNSREQIRWGKIVECPNRPKLANKYNNMGVADIISDEESTYFKLLNEAETKLPQIVKKLGGIIDAKMLVKLQTTYGYEPDIVSTIMDIEIEKLMPEYETEMDVHRSKSRNKKFQK